VAVHVTAGGPPLSAEHVPDLSAAAAGASVGRAGRSWTHGLRLMFYFYFFLIGKKIGLIKFTSYSSKRTMKCAVEKALLIVKERRTILSNTAPASILPKLLELRIDKFVKAMEALNVEPYNMVKCFLADLAVVVTRVWEAYTVDDEGKII
jgi:hypothetical protein